MSGRRAQPRPPRRFVVGEAGVDGGIVLLSDDDAHHATRVLRLRPGDALTLTTPAGTWDGVIASVAPRVAVRLGTRLDAASGGPRIELALGMAHAGAMDDAFRAAVEMDVALLIPVVCARGEHAAAEVLARRMERWRRVVAEAVKQCRRTDLPQVAAPVSVADLARRGSGTRLLMAPGAAPRLRIGGGEPWLVAIGPEGGFAPEEERELVGAGFAAVGLGPHLLRVPTAVVAALATVRAAGGPPRPCAPPGEFAP